MPNINTPRVLNKSCKVLLKSLLVLCTIIISMCASLANVVTVDKIVTTHQSAASTKIASPAITTSSANEVLFAFISSDGSSTKKQTFSTVTGGSLTWRFRQRTNVQPGTAEIWEASASSIVTNAVITATRSGGSYSGSIIVAAFIGASSAVDGAVVSASALSGAPLANLTTTQPGSVVWAVGDDWDQAAARSVGPNQTKIDEYLAPAGDTFWLQSVASAIPSKGTIVTINDISPAADRWNLSLIEIVPGSTDTTAPSAPGNLSVNVISQTQVDLSWTASTDAVGVSGYNIIRNGAQIGTTATLTYSDMSASANTTYSYTVTARDAAGNISGPSNSAAATTPPNPPDTQAPTVSLTSPANGAVINGTVTISASASDNVGVAGVQFTLDGVNFGAEKTSTPYTISWNTTAYSDGVHILSAAARDSAGNVGNAAPVSITVSNGVNPAQVGQWSSVMNWPIVAINMVLLNSGKVLMWDGGPDCIGALTDNVWDPISNVFTQVNLENQPELRDIFCSGQTVLADGRVLVVGGHDCTSTTYIGASISNMFDPSYNQWTFLPDMTSRRWYPTATTLPDGRALVTAGSVKGTVDYWPIPEVYDPAANTWTALSSANKVIPNYPFMFVLPDGRVLAAGSDESKMGTFALNVATQTWSTIDPTVLDAGSGIMYLPGKIMKAGSSYLSPPADNGGSVPSASTTYVLDMSQPFPAWQKTASMAYPRTHLNLTSLPDGTVLTTGGSSVIGGIDPATGVLAAELWNPSSQSWATMASEQRAREYHSTALLLPDARVLVAGSGHNYANQYAEFSAEIYSPPYLFKGARPVITSAPANIFYGAEFFAATPDSASIVSAAVIRNGSVTHAFNMDQRYVPVGFRTVTGGLMITAPANANLAPPGYYMLFLVNSNGVPSIAPMVHLSASSYQNIAMVQHASNGFEYSTANISQAFPSAITPGNFLIVTGTAARPAKTITISDSAGNTYLPAIGPVTDTAQDVTAYTWYVPSAIGGANTVTLTPNSGACAMEIHISEWSGVDTSSPLDQISYLTGTGTQISSGIKTPSQNGELIYGYTFSNQNSSLGSGFTVLSYINGDMDEFVVQSTASAVAATFTQLTDKWFAMMATFRPASNGVSPKTYAISGTVTTTGGSPVVGALVGTAGASAYTAADGSYTMNGLPAGTYTLTAAASGYVLDGPFSVTLGPDQTNINFEASSSVSSGIALDKIVTLHQSAAATSITSAAISTTGSNEVLIAFIASDGSATVKQTFSAVTGGGLTWRLRQRTNTQAGTAEIWQATAVSQLTNVNVKAVRSSGSYAGSITIAAFTGASLTVDGAVSGGNALTGASAVSLVSTRAGSWIWGVGDDWDQAAARIPGANQTKEDEFLSASGDTFWVQCQTNPVQNSGAIVTLNDTSPTTDRWNFSLIEIIPQ